nr:hypothetical protein [Tanacetum cinerariifolium]
HQSLQKDVAPQGPQGCYPGGSRAAICRIEADLQAPEGAGSRAEKLTTAKLSGRQRLRQPPKEACLVRHLPKPKSRAPRASWWAAPCWP